MNRRAFLSAAVLAPLGAALDVSRTTLILRPGRTLASIPAGYTGLSYETSQLAEPDFFSPSNKSLVELFRLLNSRGVLRLGGNSSEFCWWKVSPSAVEPALKPPPGPLENNWMPHALTAITPEAIDRLAGFLEATGWTLIYGLNLGTGTPERAAEEAAYVASKVGARLEFFQIGNEPEYYRRATNGLRSQDWDFAAYFTQWGQFARAVAARVKDARLGGPDAGASVDWIVSFARQAPAEFKDLIAACTGHYYAMGPPDDPSVNIARLLGLDSRIDAGMSRIMSAAREAKLPYRMTEGNSCYRGGKPGASDTFASALWAGDYMLHMARLGCSGVNFHGGGARQIKAALGGHLPGEALTKGTQTTGSGPYYTPIAGSPETGYFARPIFHGMLMANRLAGGTLFECELDAPGVNASAFAAKTQDGIRVALFNKDDKQDLAVEIVWNVQRRASVRRLTAPSLQAEEARFSDEAENLEREGDHFRLRLPRASAALVFLQG